MTRIDPDQPSLPPLLQTTTLGRALCGPLAQAERREWWLGNGRGTYAAGTVAGTLTRRYHGLLIANVYPPLGRMLLLAKADATLLADGREWPLFSNRWSGGAIEPRGHVHIESFRLNGRMPVWTFSVAGRRIEQRIWLTAGRDRVRCAWCLLPDASADDAVKDSADAAPPRLRVDLLANAREHHNVTPSRSLSAAVELDPERLVVHWPDLPVQLVVQAVGGTLESASDWIERFDLPLERERGLEDSDNHLRVGHAELSLEPGRWCGLVAEAEPLRADETDAEGLPILDVPDLDLDAAIRLHRARDRMLIANACDPSAGPAPLAGAPDWVRRLVLAADSFLIARPMPERPDGESIIAGYPWFGDWGRDTMIALPGLCLATGRADTARRILLTFAGFIDDGQLPNLFPGSGAEAAYNSVDAALWYLEAWRAYVAETDDLDALEQSWSGLEAIVAAYRDGTRYGITVDPADGLIRAGEPGVALTWMDAKVGDWVVTPRIGKPVEINALWYNGLQALAALAPRIDRDPEPFQTLVEQAATGMAAFVRDDGHGLLDLLDGPNGTDLAIRPNQLFAVSLPASPFPAAVQGQIVDCCRRHLLTTYGLRTLAPSDPNYRGSYRGDVRARDGAYHQGTVWAWLLGHYAIAEHRVTGDAALALSRLAPLADHLGDAGLGTIGECFDGDPPHHPRGTPAQAWSVACTLEAYWRLLRVGSDDGTS
jgi:4-alpha-glucanotransferase